MANNKLVKSSRKSAPPTPLTRLGDIEQTIDKLWNMFQAQVNRNVELVLINQQLQEELQKVNYRQVTVVDDPVHKQLTESTTSNMPELGFEKLRRIEMLLKKTSLQLRMDATHTLINIVHYLIQYGGESYPEQLVSLSGVSSATFYRIITRMRECRLIKMVRGKAVITEFGRKIYNEELKGEIEIKRASDKEQFGKDAEPIDYQPYLDKCKQIGQPVD